MIFRPDGVEEFCDLSERPLTTHVQRANDCNARLKLPGEKYDNGHYPHRDPSNMKFPDPSQGNQKGPREQAAP
jgi:hypothetical protein